MSQYGAGQTETGKVFVPPATESFTHDVDGNLTSDGRWTYSWDAENRLVQMIRDTDNPSGARQKLVFEYDHQGRRIRKQFFTYSGGWQEQSDTIFLYDSWNLVAELNANASNAKVRTYVWGTDLSGTMQGAGGVGGLLKLTYYGGTTTNGFVAYDGNGNVMALVDASNGNVCARYEYGPFAEPIRVSGPMGKLNPVRFSTKYTDDESGFLYYGYRYYNPSTGRWISRDPIGDKAFLTVYTQGQSRNWKRELQVGAPVPPHLFVGNNSISGVDAFGLKKVETGVKWCAEPGFAGHQWLEYPGGSAGFYPAGNAIWGQGEVHNPDPHAGDSDKSCGDIKLDDCTYDINKFVECVKNQSKPGKRGAYSFFVHNCGSWVGDVMRICILAAER